MDSLVFTRNQIESLGQRLLERRPNAIICYRLLRDVLRFQAGSADLETAHLQILSHSWVKELVDGQHPDGSWGRFHSMDTTVKAHFPTSEIAIRRALALGLDKDTPVMKRAVDFMEQILTGKAAWSDRVEKSEGWPICMKTITAGTLAQVDPSNPALQEIWDYWVEIAGRCFPKGEYDPDAEWKAHKDLRGIGVCYLGSRYVLTLLGARSANLPIALDRRIMDWIWNSSRGIGYLCANLKNPEPFHIFQWLESLEILSSFHCCHKEMVNALNWLWTRRNADGMWDFSSRISKSFYFPLSDGWQKPGNRSLDHSTRALALSRIFFDK
jgi:hypothetical protein